MKHIILNTFTACALLAITNGVSAQTFVDISNAGVEDGSMTNPYNTIQEGIDNTTAGGTVNVADGTYPEALNLDKDLTISATNPGNVLVDGAGVGLTIFNGSVSAQTVTINGINFNDNGFQGVNIAAPGTVVLNDVDLIGNGDDGTANNDTGSGLFLTGGIGAVSLTMIDCNADGNVGRGMTCQNLGATLDFTATRTSFDGNGELGILFDNDVTASWTDSSVSNNPGTGVLNFFPYNAGSFFNGCNFDLNGTHGFSVIDGATFSMTDTTVNGNSARGLELICDPAPIFATLTRVDAIGNGGQNIIFDSGNPQTNSLVATNCNFNNSGDISLAFFNPGSYIITDSDISGNNFDGIGRFFNNLTSSTLTVTNTTITGNGGNGIRVDQGGSGETTTITITDSTITGNATEGPLQVFGAAAQTINISNSTLGAAIASQAGAFFIGNVTADIENTVIDIDATTTDTTGVRANASAFGIPSVSLDHVTIVGPGGGTLTRGIEIKNDPDAQASDNTLVATNTIISGFGTGIQLFDDADGGGQPVFSGDNNLYFDNGVDEGPDDDSEVTIVGPEGGLFTTTDTISGDPLLDGSFVPQTGSAAINAADSTSSLLSDLDADPRPGGTGNDVGAQENQDSASVEDWMQF